MSNNQLVESQSADIQVMFLGKEYTFPIEIRDIALHLEFFKQIQEQTRKILLSQMEQRKYSGTSDEDFRYFHNSLTSIGEKVIQNISKYGIYDITLNELVYENPGFSQLKQVCGDTIHGMIQILQNNINNFQYGYDKALIDANSKITGSGVAVWTNSIASAFLYSVMEANAVSKQSKIAEEEFSKAINRISQNVNDAIEQQKLDLLVNVYYPGVKTSLDLLIKEMMNAYFKKFDEHGLIDFSNVTQYNPKHSSDILRNIDITDNVIDVLKVAFESCPYNYEVYLKALYNNMLDIETFNTSKYFLQDTYLIDEINTYIEKNKYDYCMVCDFIRAIAPYKNQDEKSVFTDVYNEEIKNCNDIYKKVNNALVDKNCLIIWIKEHIAKDAVELYEIDAESIKQKIMCSINKYNLSEDWLLSAEKFGLIEKSENESFSFDKCAENLFSVIKSYKTSIEAQAQNCKDMAARFEKELDEKISRYEKEYNLKSNAIKEIKEKLKSPFYIIHFIERNKLNSTLEKYYDELTELNKKINGWDTRKPYQEKLQKAKEFVAE